MIRAKFNKEAHMMGEHSKEFIVRNFIGAIKKKLESLELQQKFNTLEESLKTEFEEIFKPIPNVKELPDDIYCRIKLKDVTQEL